MFGVLRLVSPLDIPSDFQHEMKFVYASVQT